MLLPTDDVNGAIVSCCSPGTGCFEWIKLVVQGLPALIIGAIAGLIAYRQYHVAKAKLKLDLFEKRLAVFNATWTLLSYVAENGADMNSMKKIGIPFNNLTPQGKFLFSPEIHDYLRVIFDKWTNYGILLLQIEANAVGTDKQKNASEAAEFKAWFRLEAKEGCRDKFAPYLDFGKWHQ